MVLGSTFDALYWREGKRDSLSDEAVKPMYDLNQSNVDVYFAALENPDLIRTIRSEETLTLTGKLEKHSYPIYDTDQWEHYWLLVLDKPFMMYLKDDELGYDGTTLYLCDCIQVNAEALSESDKSVTVTGTTVLAHTAHHHTDVILIDCTVR